MEVDTSLAAIPYRFDPTEVRAIADTFANPLIVAYLKAYRHNIMVERSKLRVFGLSAEQLASDIQNAEAYGQGQLTTLDTLASVPEALRSNDKS